MASRYTDTGKWGDAWFSELKPIEKLLFNYLCDNCDIAGFIEVVPKRWANDIGTDKSTIEGAAEGLSRGLTYSELRDCIYINNFLKHQKNLPLKESNNAHLGIIKRFNIYAHKFKITDINEFIEKAMNEAIKPLPRGYGNGKGNGKGKKGREFLAPTIEEFTAYFIENGFPAELAQRVFKGYSEAEWHDTKGSKILNWKQKSQNVWFVASNKKAGSLPDDAPPRPSASHFWNSKSRRWEVL